MKSKGLDPTLWASEFCNGEQHHYNREREDEFPVTTKQSDMKEDSFIGWYRIGDALF